MDPAALGAVLAALHAGAAADGGGGAAAAGGLRARGAGAAAAGGGGGGGGGADALPLPAADTAALERLVAMGFERAAAEAALRAAFNDEEAAANRLLG